MYVITGFQNGERCYWSNAFGWVETIDGATQYSDHEHKVLTLPIGDSVEWIEVP